MMKTAFPHNYAVFHWLYRWVPWLPNTIKKYNKYHRNQHWSHCHQTTCKILCLSACAGCIQTIYRSQEANKVIKSISGGTKAKKRQQTLFLVDEHAEWIYYINVCVCVCECSDRKRETLQKFRVSDIIFHQSISSSRSSSFLSIRDSSSKSTWRKNARDKPQSCQNLPHLLYWNLG